jgi:hypothetical protein
MGEAGVAPHHVTLFTAENFGNHRDGKLREDADSLLFPTRIPILVGVRSDFDTYSDVTRFKHAVFVDASTLSSIKDDLQAWARVLGDGHERDVWEDAIRVLSGPPQDERWALILDNTDDPTLKLVPFMPKNINLTVIITSRNRNLGNLATSYHMELGEMEPEEALTALIHAARRQLPF